MGRKKLDEGQLDRLLQESLSGSALPEAETVAKLKRRMRMKPNGGRSPSLWWLPALAGTAVSGCLLYALSFVAGWRCFYMAAVLLGLCVLSSWLLTILSVIKFDCFKEASRLI